VRKLSIPLVLFFLFLFPAFGIAQTTPNIQIYFFYTEDCQSCQVILQNYLPTLKAMVPNLEIKNFDVGNPAYYEVLSKLEKKFGRPANELPVVFVGDQMLAGEMEIMEKLNPVLLELQAKGGASSPPLDIPSVAKSSSKSFTVDLVYFYQKGCPKCARANALLKYMVKKYPQLNIKETDLNTPDGKRFNETLSGRLHLPGEKRLIAPSIFIGKDCLLPDEITESKVEALIQKYGEKTVLRASEGKPALPTPPPSLVPTLEETKKAEESIIQRFKSLGVLTIISAGLIDGINPCAFATLIFFISYLSFVGRKRSEIFYVGMGYSGAVFITYLLIGFGILTFIQHLSFLPLFSKVVYILTIAFALVLGTLSLYDYVQLKRGRPSEMKLQLPDFLKKRIHRTIRQESKSTRYFLAAISAGFVVSLLEFTCTGQVYLPTILFVTNIPSLKGSAVSYLLLYNFMFITPLLIIFGIVYWGVTSEQLTFFLQKRASSIKLYTSLLFFALAGIMILSLM